MSTFNTKAAGAALALIMAAAIPTFADTTQVQPDKEITISSVLEPIYPSVLGSVGISEGSATIIVSVDSTGKMMDWVAISATRQEFVKAIANVINDWEFSPAYRNGEPIASALSISVKFRNDAIIMSMNGFQMVQALMNSFTDGRERPLIARYSELDGIPDPITIVQPAVDASIPENDRTGEVVIGFFIDPDGHVRMPIMMKCTGDERLANAAYDALAKWEFAKPTSHGRPIMVRASQKFIFNTKK